MSLREPCLPGGWYPGNPADIADFLEGFDGGGNSAAVIAPHAGWYYSGRTAALSFSALDKNVQTLVVIGGHLPGGAPFLFAEEDGVRTPMGVMEIDKELRESLKAKLPSSGDRYRDNTVEILLPMARFFYPSAKLLWVRFPAEFSSFEAGKTLAQTAESLGRRIAVAGSTDLSHYGANYDFSPKGRGIAALNWVRDVNDANLIKAILAGDPAEVLERAVNDLSACSAGAVLGTMGFAQAKGSLPKAKLLEYRTSADADGNNIPDSFVGYASISF